MNDETTTKSSPIGLYHDPASGQFIGAIESVQADAMIQQGYVLHTEGREAAMASQADIEALKGNKTGAEVQAEESKDDKKGKKG